MPDTLKRAALTLAAVAVAAAASLWAAQTPPAQPDKPQEQKPAALAQLVDSHTKEKGAAPLSEKDELLTAAVSLPVAALLGAALAFRPQRRGTPPRDPAVIHTQIILSIVGALVMLVVGASLARAFGIVGAANLVRYRSKIDDPKDAGVMLSCLALGLASGVGIYWIAALATVFLLAVIWVLESSEPEGEKNFLLKVKAKDSGRIRDGLERALRKNGVKYELRTSSQDDLTYWVRLPLAKRTDRITNAILDLVENRDTVAVEWEDKKASKEAA
jgi:uncharacterized membrane protein YhiD involved in acid resistance